jgi:hypothetical protein
MPAPAPHPFWLALARSKLRPPGAGYVFRLVVVVVAVASGAGLNSARAGDSRDAKVDYNFSVRPVLADRCFVCHGPDERARKADLRLDRSDSAVDSGAVVPGKPDESELVRRITLPPTDPDHMPPAKSNLALSPEEVAQLRRWVAEGAEYKPHWALLPLPRSVPAPAVSDPSWPATPVDPFVLARLDLEGLKPSPPASPEEWLRRVTFDLTGLPPALDEVDAFLADRSPRAFEKVVDRLLASPRFGERVAMDWLDVARYADSFGYQADGDTNVWPWRDWVIRALNRNLPYDQFLTWQLAGDLLLGATREQRLATAFNRLNRMTNEGGSIPEEWRNEYVSDRVHTFGTAALGLTLECTRCHDHKYDPLTMKDYYSLGAFFNSIDEWGTYDSAKFRPTPTVALPTADQERAIAALAKEVKECEARLAEIPSAREAAFRQWLDCDDLSCQPETPGPAGHYPLDAVEGGKVANLADSSKPGKTSAANVLDEGKTGKALRFSGDDPAEFTAAPAKVERHEPFTAAFWLWIPRRLREAVVFHREQGTDTGFHGAELTLDAGRLQFALVRFWPGDALAVRTRDELPAERWAHVAVTYDGSGRASGVRLYVDGAPAVPRVVRDKLSKNVEVNGPGFVFGERFRSLGLKGARLDDLRLYPRVLAPVEVGQLHDGKALAEAVASKDAGALRDYYLAAVDVEASAAREALKRARAKLFAAQTEVFEVMAMEEMPEPRPAYLLARGAYDAPKTKPVGRDTPTALPPFAKGAPRDRLGLARWLTDPDHPLTARVAVNRYWQLFFGRGLVATTENFGIQGALPAHPELLNALARGFVASGWDVKGLCRTIVLSSTYRQRSSARPALRERDLDNLLLACGPSLRLSAEMLRDAALAASGLLVEKAGGPPVKPPQPPGLWKGQNAFLPDYVADKGPNAYRRSLYTFWRRTSPPPNMLALDAPSREVCVVRRQSTTTPLQPLVLLNDPQFVEAALALGERMLTQGGSSDAERVTHAFRLAATRSPTDRERSVLMSLFEQQRDAFRADTARARAFLAGRAHAPPAGLDPADLAAAAVTAGVILNLDASVTAR